MTGKWQRVLVILGVLGAVLLAGCGGGGGGGGSAPGAAVRQFFTLGLGSKTEQALEYVVSESQALASSMLMWSGVIGIAGVRLTGVTIEREQIRGSEATVRYRLRFNVSMYDSTGEIRLVQRGGRWKIIEFIS